MTPEEWLREHGIEVARQDPSAPHGQFAGQATGALPYVPPTPAIDDLETQLVPSVVHIDLHIGGDVAEWPTTTLPNPVDPATDSTEWAYIDADPDFALEDEMTIPLPVIPAPAQPGTNSDTDATLDVITHMPTRRLSMPNDEA
jgi:hypothetical protein